MENIETVSKRTPYGGQTLTGRPRCMAPASTWRTIATYSVLFWLCAFSLYGQGPMTPAQKREQWSSVPKGIPSDILAQVQALGARMRASGREETLLEGQLTYATGEPKTIRVVHQISGIVRIEGLRESIPLTFDGDFPGGALDRADDSVLEAFVMDTVEGMVYSLRSGGAMRLLGRGFGPDPRTNPKYNGPRYDIYEVTAPVRTRTDASLRMRRYYFDSQTRLLVTTRYQDPTVGRGLHDVTHFSNWQDIEGSMFPGRIEHYEDGRLVFSFTAQQITSRPRSRAVSQ